MSIISRIYSRPIFFLITLFVVAVFGIYVEYYRVLSLPLLLLLLASVSTKAKGSSLVFHAFFLLLIVTCFVQIVGLLFWILGIAFTWPILIILLSLVVLALYLIRLKKRLKQPAFDFITKDDIVSISIATASVILLTIATLNGGTTTQQLLRYFTSGFDNTAHLSLTLSTYDEQGYIYGQPDDVTKKLVYSDFSAYPKGWHLVNSLILHGVSEHLDVQVSTKNVFVLYFAVLMTWYGLVIFFASRLMIWLARLHLRKKKQSSSSILYSVTIATMAILQLVLLISAFKSGFGNYFALITYLIVIVQCGIWLHNKNISRSSFLLYGLLLSTGVSLTWFLAAPIGFLFVLLALLYTFKQSKDFFGWIIRHRIVLGTSILLVAVCIAQVFIQFKFSAVPNNINATGGIWNLNYLLICVLLGSSILWIARSDKKVGFTIPLLLCIISFGVMSGMIYFYQFYTAGVVNYYAIKLTSLLVMILIIFCGAIAAVALDRISTKAARFLAIISVFCSVFIIPLAIGLNMEDLRIAINDQKKLSPHSSSVIVNLLNQNKAYSSNLFVMKDLDYEEDIITTHFMNMLSREYPSCVQSFVWHKIASDKEAAINDVSECATKNTSTGYYVIASTASYDTLVTRFKNNSNIEVILSN